MAVENYIVNSVSVIDLCTVMLIGAIHINHEAINTNEPIFLNSKHLYTCAVDLGCKMNCSAVAVRITDF